MGGAAAQLGEVPVKPTHAQLVALGCKWLRSKRRLSIVFGEFRTNSTNEQPDCIGWNGYGWSIIIECKASRADFLRDRKKTARRRIEGAMGQERYYLAEEGVLGIDDLPLGWGLIVVRKGRVHMAHPAAKGAGTIDRGVYAPDRYRDELTYLLAFMRRVFGIAKLYKRGKGQKEDMADLWAMVSPKMRTGETP